MKNLKDQVEAGRYMLIIPSQVPNPFPEVGDNIGKRRDQGGREADSQQRQKTEKCLVSTTPLLGSEIHKVNC